MNCICISTKLIMRIYSVTLVWIICSFKHHISLCIWLWWTLQHVSWIICIWINFNFLVCILGWLCHMVTYMAYDIERRVYCLYACNVFHLKCSFIYVQLINVAHSLEGDEENWVRNTPWHERFVLFKTDHNQFWHSLALINNCI